MENFKARCGQISYCFEKALEFISALIIGATTLMICTEVFTRAVFGTTFAVFEEGPRLFFCYAVLPMLGVIYKRGRHISVETLPQKLKGRSRTLLMLAIDMAMIAGSIIFMVAGISGTQSLYTTGMRVVGVLDLPEYIFMLSIPVGGGLLLLSSLEVMIKNLALLFVSDTTVMNIDSQTVDCKQPLL